MKRLGLATLFALMLVTTVLSTAGAAMTPYFTAKIYDLKDHSKLMFNYKSEIEVAGDVKTQINTVTDLNGDVLVVETTKMKAADGALISFEQDQKQLATLGRVEIRDKKAFFTFTKDGKAKNDDEAAEGNFVVTSTLLPYIHAHWEELMKGEIVKIRLGVLDRQESVGFQFKKEGEKKVGDTAAVVLKMKASSLIISAVVNPLFFTFDSSTKKLLEVEGRTSVKVKVDGKFKDFDGYTVYTY